MKQADRRPCWRDAGAALAVYAALFLLHSFIRPYSDDLWYWEKADTWRSNFWGLQAEYYLTWSGRVVSNFLAFFLMHNRFWLWRALNPLFILALGWLMARLVRARPTLPQAAKSLMALLLLGPGVLDYAVFWATGSLYYLWPVVMALFALVPFFDLALRGQAGLRLFVPRLLCAALACACVEQLTPCIMGFMGLALLARVARTRTVKGLWRHLALLFACLPGTLALFLSPGSRVRYEQESYLYYQQHAIGFYEVPLAEKVTNGLAWMYGAVFTALYLLLLLLYAACWHRGFAGPKHPLRWQLFALGGAGLALAFPQRVDAALTFAAWRDIPAMPPAQALLAVLPYLFWTAFLAALGWLLARQGAVYLAAFLAALATVCLLFFSPTIYTSGERTLFIGGVMLCTMLCGVLPKKPSPPVWLAGACLAGVHAMQLVSRLRLFFGGG